MLSIRTILHPTDFSDRSEYAFRLAYALARDHGSRLVLMHVAPLPAVVYGEGIVPPAPEHFLDELKEKLHRLQVPDRRIHVDHLLKEGEPVTEILEAAKELHADLIVMGTHGRTGLGRMLMGSVAELVVRRATCPVLTVRTPFPELVLEAEPLAEPAGV
jgi:nucleotide-binding universal stress UspA family protein